MSAHLDVLSGPHKGESYQLTGDATCIGRGLGDIKLPNDTELSGMHAVILLSGSDYTISDADSTNGVYLNDIRTDSGILKDGDIIRIGASTLRFCIDNTTAATQQPKPGSTSVFSNLGKQPKKTVVLVVLAFWLVPALLSLAFQCVNYYATGSPRLDVQAEPLACTLTKVTSESVYLSRYRVRVWNDGNLRSPQLLVSLLITWDGGSIGSGPTIVDPLDQYHGDGIEFDNTLPGKIDPSKLSFLVRVKDDQGRQLATNQYSPCNNDNITNICTVKQRPYVASHQLRQRR